MKLFITLFTFTNFLFNLCYGQSLTFSPSAIRGTQANTSGLKFVNLNANSPAGVSNGKNLTVDGSGNVILTLEPNATPNYWQSTSSDIFNTNSGAVKISNLQLGNSTTAVAGAIRWNGTNFEGYTGSAWVPFTTTINYTYGWIPAVQTSGGSVFNSPCQETCNAAGGIPFSDQQTGYTCISRDGGVGNNVGANVFTGYTCYYNSKNLGVLAKCYCRFPK